MSAICVRNLVKEFPSGAGPVRVLREVDLSVAAGELTLLIGPSGCGKTTLISVLAGLLTATGGSVEVFGRDVTRLRGDALVRYRLADIGFVFQQYHLIGGLTAAENAAVPLVAAGRPWPEALARSTALLARLGMADHAGKPPRQLSGGQQQRVAIARALVSDPRVLLCDEPTAALDAASGQAVMRLLREVAVRPDRVALVVSHDPRVYGFADRLVTMEDGRVVRDERPAQAGATAEE